MKTPGLQRLLAAMLLVLVLPAGCGAPSATRAITPYPSPSPTSTPVPSPDVPIYKNTFEGSIDLAAAGITSPTNTVLLETANVAYQSGSQALEANGTLAASRYSGLSIELSMSKLIGQDAIDLSNKNIGFSYYIPADSPIDKVVLVAKQGDRQVTLAATPSAADQPRGNWHYAQFDVQSIHQNNSWSYTNLTNNEARQVIQNCQVLILAGMRNADGTAVNTSFLVDDFKWITTTNLNALDRSGDMDTLRQAADARGILLGGIWFIYPQQFDPWYLYTLAHQVNLTTVGGGPTFPAARPADINSIEYDYTFDDWKLAFAEGNGLVLEAGTGGFLPPKWVLDADYTDARVLLLNKVRSDVSHLAGKVLYWGIMNEVVDDDGRGFRNRQKKDPDDAAVTSWNPYSFHYSPWVDGNDISLIEDAFATAHAADPGAVLYLNDHTVYEIGGTKSEFFYDLVTGMRDRGVPIGGVGFEFHLIYPPDPWNTPGLADLDGFFSRVDQNIKRYAEAGFKVMFTEVECQVRMDDLDLSTQAGQDELARRQEKQAEIYARIVRLAVDNPNVAFITFWSLADLPGTSAFGPPFYPLTETDAFLFDKNYDPKPAYYAVLAVLMGR